MADESLASARSEYLQCLEATAAKGEFTDAAAARHAELATRLSMPPALEQRLALDAYYGWLTDASERGDLEALEGAASVRKTLNVGAPAVAELYAKTEIDDSVLSSAAETLVEDGRPLSTAAMQRLTYLEDQLLARPGLAASVASANSE